MEELNNIIQPKRVRRFGWAKIALAGFILICGLGVGGAYLIYLNEISGVGTGAKMQSEVKKGDSFSSLASRLKSQKIIKSVLFFDIYIRIHSNFVLLPGLYSFRHGESDAEVVATLKRGPNEFKLTVIPGMTLDQIAEQIGKIPGHNAGQFLKAASTQRYISPFLPKGSHNLEGLLSPDTYFVLPDESNHQVIQEMLDQTAIVAGQAGLHSNTNANSVTPYQELIVASLIQREALVLSDYAKVARVIYNRLAIPMNLQFDSTVLYGLGLTSGSPTLGDLSTYTPYNTYVNSGLPPTPISAPSFQAIRAALDPAPGPWIYFVTTSSNGAEAFSVTYQGQLANEALAAQRGLS